MPPEWEDDVYRHDGSLSPLDGKPNKLQGSPSLRPPLYNAEDYTSALKQLFGSVNHHHSTVSPSSILLENGSSVPPISNGHNGSAKGKSQHVRSTTPEMSMKKFLNGSELLFKLEADLRYAYPSFVQEFVSSHCEGVSWVLEALKTIQSSLEECNGIREQRKVIMDEMKCLQCLQLTLRNIEAVGKLSSSSGGLYPVAKAVISTVTSTRIIALEILTCICKEGGSEGHDKVSEAISTLRLRMGEPIRCKLLVGSISSASAGTFQSRGIQFLTAWIASAPSPKQKVHIQCELEEAGFNPSAIRKGAELAGAREAREVQKELEEWDRVAIDVDTLSRQNCQLRNSVATLQQELATLKDKLKRMDAPSKSEKRSSRSKQQRSEEVTTPVDSEEEAEQIHQILEDLNNIVNTEMHLHQQQSESSNGKNSSTKKEKDIVPVHLVKSPPPKKPTTGLNPLISVKPRPWPGSSASDDDDSDIIDMLEQDTKTGKQQQHKSKQNVRKVVEQLENMERTSPNGSKIFHKTHQKLQNLPIAMAKSVHRIPEPEPDYPLPTNFHKANHMASKFVNFKSSKLLHCPSPDSSSRNNSSNSYAEVFDKSTNNDSSSNGGSRFRFSPHLGKQLKSASQMPLGNGLRRSESVHASLATPSVELISSGDRILYEGRRARHHMKGRSGSPIREESFNHHNKGGKKSKDNKVWKSMESLLSERNQHQHHPVDESGDDNFTLRWKYPILYSKTGAHHHSSSSNATTPSPKNTSKSKTAKLAANRSQQQQQQKVTAELLSSDYRQSRFSKNNGMAIVTTAGHHHGKENSGGGSGLNIFSKYSKKERAAAAEAKDKENMTMFSLPPILMPGHGNNGMDMNCHRISDLPSGLY